MRTLALVGFLLLAGCNLPPNYNPPPLIFGGYQPPPQQPIYAPQRPINCVTMGNIVHCQ